MACKVVVLGLDSLDFKLLERWTSKGGLPNFANLMSTACWGHINNPEGVEAGSVWQTFTTGLAPDHHAQFNGCHRFDHKTYNERTIDLQDRVASPIWVHASEQSRRVAVVDAPYELLEKQVNGIQVIDWLPHVFTRYPGPSSYPSKLAGELVQRFGKNPFDGPNRCPTNDCPFETAEDIAFIRDGLLRRMEWKTQYFEELLQQERWDLFFGVYHEAHDIAHKCWHVHDPDHEQHDEAVAAAVGDPMLDVYQALDKALGRLLAVIGDDTHLFVYSSHGAGPERTGTDLLDDVLLHIEQAWRREHNQSRTEPDSRDTTAQSRPLDSIASMYKSIVPTELRRLALETAPMKALYRRLDSERRRQRLFVEQINNHATGGVRINLKGREPHGVVSPAELDGLRQRLINDLEQLTNADTGERVIESITDIRDLYDGPQTHWMPDLLLEWNKSAPIYRIASPLFGSVERSSPRVRTGDHVEKFGTFFAVGPDLDYRHLNDNVDVTDFAPTIAKLLDMDLTPYQGAPIDSICNSVHSMQEAAQV